MKRGICLVAMMCLVAFLSVASCEGADPIKVAVYTGGTPAPYGCKGMYDALAASPAFEPVRLATIEPAELTKHPILVMGSVVNLSNPDMGLPYEEILRNYVNQGGALLVTHFGTGLVKNAPRAFAKSLFPEIWKPVGKIKANAMKKAKSDHPILTGLPSTINHSYWDHIQLDAGPKGTVLAVDDDGKAVAVCGSEGKGRVLALGNAVGIAADESGKMPEGEERALFLNGVRWLAGADSSNLRSEESLDSFADLPGLFARPASNQEAIDQGYVIVPEPQRIALLGGRCPINADTAFVITEVAEKRDDCLGLDMLNERLAKRHGFTLEAATSPSVEKNRILVGIPGESGQIAALCKEWGVAVPENEEGYALVAKDGTVLIAAPTARGACYGVQSLIQLLRRDKDGTYVPNVAINDWPDMPIRGMIITMPSSDRELMKRALRLLLHLKGNTVCIDNRWALFDGAPDIFYATQRDKDYTYNLEDLAEVAAEGHRIGLDVVPGNLALGNSFSRALSLDTPEIEDYFEIPEDWREKYPNAKVLQQIDFDTCWRWSSPKVQKMIHDHTEAIIKAAKPRNRVHLCSDEVFHFAISKHDKGKDQGKLYADYVNTMHAQMAGHGLKLWMWPDMLLRDIAPENVGAAALGEWTSELGHHVVTYTAIDMIPKDIIMHPWYYGPIKERLAYKYLIDKGFPVVALAGGAGGGAKKSPACSYYAAIEGRKYGALGDVGHGWAMRCLKPESAIHNSMEATWTVGRPRPGEHHEADLAIKQDFAFLGPKPAMLPNRESFPIDISAFRNTGLVHRKGKGGWFRYGPHRDFRGFRPEEVEYEEVVFDLPKTKAAKACIILGGKDELKKLRYGVSEVKDIPVNRKAASLVFLHTCMMKTHQIDNEIARYTVHYADGGREIIHVRYGVNIGGWMSSGLSGGGSYTQWLMAWGYLPDSSIAFAEANKRGDRMTLDAFEWVNPYPDREIDSIDVEVTRHDAGVRMALLAISGVAPTDKEIADSQAPPAVEGAADALVSYWSFDDEGETAADAMRRNPGRLLGPERTQGVQGGALSFDGAGDCVDLGGDRSLWFDISDFTYDFWLKTDGPGGRRLMGRFARQGSSGGQYVQLLDNGRVYFYMNADNRQNCQGIGSKTRVTDGEWHHVSAVRSGPTLKLYVDGKLEAEKTFDAPCLLRGDSAHAYLGSTWVRDKETYKGLLDEVKVYDKALSDEEVTSNYRAIQKAL